MEQPNPQTLIKLLEQTNTPKEKIIEILSNIIKVQIMYGGTLEDKINHLIHLAEKNISLSPFQ